MITCNANNYNSKYETYTIAQMNVLAELKTKQGISNQSKLNKIPHEIPE